MAKPIRPSKSARSFNSIPESKVSGSTSSIEEAAIWSAVHPQVKVAVEALGNLQIQWLTETIETGRKDKTFATNNYSPQAQADHIFSSLQGGLLFSHLK